MVTLSVSKEVDIIVDLVVIVLRISCCNNTFRHTSIHLSYFVLRDYMLSRTGA